ncbi:MAG: T9SS type A sorting domain-containing protein [Cyclobacteriaceae bacterium]|nr:T9SS type A sorting domain-containing protein [Cyclobacteriaceae bacterium HetDA_MAG_MS6]
MRKCILSIVYLVFLTLSIASTAQDSRPIGANLSDLSNFASQIMFKDVMKQSSVWQIQPVDESVFALGEEEVFDFPVVENNYPAQVPFEYDGQLYRVHAGVLNSQPQQYLHPAGEYTLIFEGTGRIILDWDVANGPLTFTTPNVEHLVDVVPSGGFATGGIQIIIDSSAVNDPIRNIRFILPGFADSYESNPFHPSFLSLLDPFEALRFMKPTAVERNTISRWSQRTKLDNYTYFADVEGQLRFGMPYELIVRLCNEQMKDPWINIPFGVDDAFIDSLATIFTALNPALKLYVEYGNETWNTLYPLARQFLIEQGLEAGLDTDSLNANLKYHVLRSYEVFGRFEQVFGNRADQVKGVIATQSWDRVGRVIVDAIKDPSINPGGRPPHAIAIAVYMGIEAIDNLLAQNQGNCDFDGDHVMDHLESIFEAEMSEFVLPYQQWTDSLGIELFAYEGGQHVSTGAFGLNTECVQNAVSEANRSQRMADLYCRYFDYWYEHSGDLLMSFVLTEAYQVAGAFGILESVFQDPETSVKWQAHVDCVFEPEELLVTSVDEDRFMAYPNPTSDLIYFSSEPMEVSVFNLMGVKIKSFRSEMQLDISDLPTGIYLLDIKKSRDSYQKIRICKK